MKIAIIGANGFVGTRLVETLLLGTGEHRPVAVVRRPAALALACRFEVDWKLGDALEAESLARALEGCDAVIHAALGDPRQIEQMPAVLCKAAARARIRRVVYLSSASVHGQAPAAGTDETTPLRTGQALEYNDAKVRAEQSFFKSCAKRGLEGFALRPGVVYGPRSRWIADLAKDLREGRAWLHGEGEAVLNSIHVDNLIHAALRCVEAPGAASGAYLVNDPGEATWGWFTKETARALGVSENRIHKVSQFPVFTRDTRTRLREAATGTVSQLFLPALPGSLKLAVKRLLEPVPAQGSVWQLPGMPVPRFTEELVLLQQCAWRLPHAKAEAMLGYTPRVSAAEGLASSLSWLAFAEGRTC